MCVRVRVHKGQCAGRRSSFAPEREKRNVWRELEDKPKEKWISDDLILLHFLWRKASGLLFVGHVHVRISGVWDINL